MVVLLLERYVSLAAVMASVFLIVGKPPLGKGHDSPGLEREPVIPPE